MNFGFGDDLPSLICVSSQLHFYFFCFLSTNLEDVCAYTQTHRHKQRESWIDSPGLRLSRMYALVKKYYYCESPLDSGKVTVFRFDFLLFQREGERERFVCIQWIVCGKMWHTRRRNKTQKQKEEEDGEKTENKLNRLNVWRWHATCRSLIATSF